MALCYTRAMAKAAPAPKRLFLVDAMGFIFRAFFAPMARLNSPAGVPTKVPYLFSNMLRKLQKEHAPDYLAVVFDTRGPTFRDKLFDKYKAQRPPMPDDLAVQLPLRAPHVRGHAPADSGSSRALRPTT